MCIISARLIIILSWTSSSYSSKYLDVPKSVLFWLVNAVFLNGKKSHESPSLHIESRIWQAFSEFAIFIRLPPTSPHCKRLNNDKSERNITDNRNTTCIRIVSLWFFCLSLLLTSWQNYFFSAFLRCTWQIRTHSSTKDTANKKALWLQRIPKFHWKLDENFEQGTVILVVQDFNVKSLHCNR